MAIYAFFLLSGVSALTYEIVWTRQLTLVAGATTPAVSTVLAVFMGGLAFGAWLFGPVADRSRHLLRWYGGLELGIGLFALVQPYLLLWMDKAYIHFIPEIGHDGLGVLGLRIGISALLLIVPTMLMGGTLPILIRFVSRRDECFGRDLGTLYSVNLAGAVIGSALTGFILIRVLGISGTLGVAVLVNLSIGFAALLMSRNAQPVPAPSQNKQSKTISKTTPASSTPTTLRLLLWSVVAFSGLLTMGYEVAWTRMLVFAFGSTIYSFTIILIVFLMGLALGSAIFARLDGRINGVLTLIVCHFLAAASALALAPVTTRLNAWTQSISAIWGFTGGVQLTATIAGSILVMLIPVTLMGIIFPLSSRLLIKNITGAGKGLGLAYWINTLGSMSGSLLVGLLFIPLLSIKGCLLALAAIQILLALLLLPWSQLTRRATTLVGASGLLLAALMTANFMRILPGPSPFDWTPAGESTSPGENPETIEAHRDDIAASVTVVRSETGVRVLRINGFEATSDSGASGYMPMMSHLPMLIHGHAQKVLVICFGTGSTAGAVLLYPGAQVDAVDINQTVLDFAPWFKGVNHGVYQNPRAKLILDDGRNYLATTTNFYDVITSEPMPPTHAGVVNLYSREYYALARERLNPGGLLVQWLPFHLLTVDEARSILRTVQDVFPETSLWLWNTTGLIVARKDAATTVDWAALSQAYHTPALATDLARLDVPTPQEFLQLYALSPKAVRDFVQGVPIITDNHPSLEFHPPRHTMTFATFRGITANSAVSLLNILRLRTLEEPPVQGMSEQDKRELSADFRTRNIQLIGELYHRRGLPAEAAKVFEQGLLASTKTADRATFLYNLAITAYEQGNNAGALAFIEQCLTEVPGNPMALELKNKLQAPSQRKPGG